MNNAKRIYTKRIQEFMWAGGRPATGTKSTNLANVYRALIAAGLDDKQAAAVLRLTYDAAEGYTWQLPDGSHLRRATQERNAAKHPNGKDAEDLAADREGRPSRWGTPEFHRAG